MAKKNVKNNVNQEKENKSLAANDAKDSDITQAKVPLQVALESAYGAASFLASKTESHKFLFAQDFDWLIMPPVSLKQFQVVRRQKDNAPIAFVSWANINEEVEQRILSGNRKLSPADWNSGKKTYLIDIISPFLSQKQVLEQLSASVFKDKELNLTRAGSNGKKLETVKLTDLLDEIKSEKEQTRQ